MENTYKPISIKKTAKIVASNNYDKKNIFIYFALNLVLAIILSFTMPTDIMTPQDMMKNLDKLIISVIISIIGGLWVSGVGLVSYNNAIRRQKGVIPNSFTDIGRYYITALAYGFGLWINLILITAITFVLAYPIAQLTNSPTITFWALLIPCLFLVSILFGTIFNFYTSLKFSDLFNYKKGYKFIADAGWLFWSVFWRSTVLMILCVVALIITTGILGMFIAPLFIMGKMQAAMQAGNVLGGLFGCAVGCVFQIYIIELTAQFVRAVLKKQQNINIQEQ